MAVYEKTIIRRKNQVYLYTKKKARCEKKHGAAPWSRGGPRWPSLPPSAPGAASRTCDTLTPSHPHTLTPSHPHTLTPSHPHTLTHSHPHTLKHSHPPAISPRCSQSNLRAGFKVQGFGSQVQGFGFQVQGFGFQAQGLGLKVQGLRFWRLGFRAFRI